MDTLAIIALVLSIISILLWVYSFLFRNGSPIVGRSAENTVKHEVERNDPPREDPSVPQVRRSDPPVQSPSREYLEYEAQFMGETQKFSHMVRKNLEMLNTRVGIKFDVKPISEKFSRKQSGPGYVDSMDVTEKRDREMLPDDSSEEA